MATINYTKTQLGNGRFTVEWAGMVAGDTCQPFDGNGAQPQAHHFYRGATDTVTGTNYGSCETASPVNGVAVISNTSGDSLGAASTVVLYTLFQTRWVYPVVSATGTGAMTVVVLFEGR